MSHMKELYLVLEDAWLETVERAGLTALTDHQDGIDSTPDQKAEIVDDIQPSRGISDAQWEIIRGDLRHVFKEVYTLARAQLRMLGT